MEAEEIVSFKFPAKGSLGLERAGIVGPSGVGIGEDIGNAEAESSLDPLGKGRSVFPEVGVVTEEETFDVKCALFNEKDKGSVAVDVRCGESTREVDVPDLALGSSRAKGRWRGGGCVTTGHGLVWRVAGATAVASMVWKRTELCGEAVSEAAPGIESFESRVAESSVEG
jgi:hypothetical protein